MRTNCPNCGAPIEPGAARCPYCRTPYETTQHLLKIDANGITFSTVSITEGRALGIRSPSAALGEQLSAGISSGIEGTHARLLEHGTRYLADYDYQARAARKLQAGGYTWVPRPDGGLSMAFTGPKKPRGLLRGLWRRIKRKD